MLAAPGISPKCGMLWIRAFLPRNRKSKYRQFATKCMRDGERMTEYLDELIHLFRKARLGTFARFQNEEVKNRLLTNNVYPLRFWER